MKMPNGYGSVYKLSGNRRNPWIARRTIGWDFDETGKRARQRYETIGYFRTRAEALHALSEANKNPYSIDKDLTLKEVYDKWSAEHFQEIGPSAIKNIRNAWVYMAPIESMKMKDIRCANIEGLIRKSAAGPTTKKKMSIVLNQIFAYALKHEIVEKNYASMCTHTKIEATQKSATPFSPEELEKLWDAQDTGIADADAILIQIYSGWRPAELVALKLEDIDLIEEIMCGGMKTKAGKNRIVPIHPKIMPLLQRRYAMAESTGSEWLFTGKSGPLTFNAYAKRFQKCLIAAGITDHHHPHEARHTFISMAKEAGMNEYILKLIVGHSIQDLTERTYTHRTIEQLKAEIRKIV